MEYNFSGLQKVEESKFNFEGLQPIEPIETTTSVRQPIRSMQPQPSEQRTEQSISLMESKPTKPLSESEPIPKPYERMDVPAATELSRLAPEGLAPEIEPERKGIKGGATRGWEPEGLYDRPEDFSTVSGAISQFSKNFLSSASAGLPEYVEGKMGVSEQPQGEMEEIAAGFGNLAGFIIGLPGRVTTAVAKQILKQYPRLITTGSEGVFKRIAKNLATEAPALGTGFAVSGLGRAAGEDNLEDALNVLSNEFKSGLGVGATFGVTRGVFPSSRIARIATGMALLDTLRGTSPWDERSLKQKVFDYGIDLWFLWKGGANPASIERAIRDRLHETFKEGKPLPKELLKVFKKRKWADELLVLDELEKAIKSKTPSKVPSERTEMPLKDTLSEGVGITPQLKAESGIKDIKPPSKPEAITESVPKAKEPWEMTRAEYGTEQHRLYEELGNEMYVNSAFNRYASDASFELHQESMKYPKTIDKMHYVTVKRALSEGKTPYKGWEKDYPDLAKVSPKAPVSAKVEKTPLIEEAKKYKTAEEFVEGQGERFYRGVNKGDERRIETVFKEAEGLKFVARKRESAELYGKDIEEVIAKPNAKILYEGSKDFKKLKQGRLVDSVDAEIKRAKEAGYDAISFKKDSDIGTVIINEEAFTTKSQLTDIWNEAHKVEKGAKGKQKPIVPKKPKPQPKLEPKPTKPSKPSIPVEKVKTTENSWKEVAVDAIKSGKDPVKEVIDFYKESGFVGGQDTIRDMVNNLIKSKKKGKDVTLDMLGAQSVYEKTLGMMKQITTTTNKLIEETKGPEYAQSGIKKAKEAMINHDRNNRAVDFLHLQLKKVVNDIVPNKVRQMLMVHAYEHKMKGPEWDSLNEIERGVVRWAAKEKAKLDKYIDDNNVLERMKSEFINHIYHHWINPKSGDPFTAFYGKFSKGLPQAIQRKIPDYRTGIAKGLKPATTNIGELIGLEWVAATRANNARQLMKVLHGIKGDPNGTIVLRGEPQPIRMVESWNKLDKQNLTDGYVRYDNPVFDKTIAFKDTKGNTVLMKGAVGVREEIFPFVQAYIESPNYGTFSQINFAVKSIKLGLSLFHVMSLGMQELANIRAPFVHIPAGLKLIRNLTPELKLLHQEGLEVKKGYEDLGYQNKFFDNATVLGKTGNIASTPIRLMRNFIFDIVQPGMKTSFADYQLRKTLPEYLKKAGEKMTAEEVMARYADGKSIPEAALKCARDVVKKSDGHFSGEHYKRALLETNRFMVKMYFSPQARVIWQGLLLSPTWQREHILVAKNVIKSFMPDSMIKKIDKMSPSGFEEIGPIKSQYRRYALGGIMILGAVDLWNQIATQEMDGKAKHLWENPKGKRFAVRAWWNEPDYTVVGKTGRTRNIKGGAAYIRPIKSLFEVAEWFSDPFEKFSFKVAPLLTATINQFFPSIDKYDGWEIKERLKDLGIDILAPIVVDQAIMAAENKKEWWGALTSSIGAPSSKEKRPPGPKPPFKSPFKGNKDPFR